MKCWAGFLFLVKTSEVCAIPVRLSSPFLTDSLSLDAVMRFLFYRWLLFFMVLLLVGVSGCGGMSGKKGQNEGEDVPRPPKPGKKKQSMLWRHLPLDSSRIMEEKREELLAIRF